MKEITNEEFNQAYSNIDNISIINFIKKKYKKRIPRDELISCGMIGLWKTLRTYNIDKGYKFTSLLYMMVKWECLKWIEKKEKDRLVFPKKLKNVEIKHEFYSEVHDYLSILPKDLAEIVEDRVVYNMSISTIGKKKNIGRDAVQSRIDKAYRILEKYVNRTILK